MKNNSFVLSVRLSIRLSVRNNLAPTQQIFMNFGILIFCKNLLRKF